MKKILKKKKFVHLRERRDQALTILIIAYNWKTYRKCNATEMRWRMAERNGSMKENKRQSENGTNGT